VIFYCISSHFLSTLITVDPFITVLVFAADHRLRIPLLFFAYISKQYDTAGSASKNLDTVLCKHCFCFFQFFFRQDLWIEFSCGWLFHQQRVLLYHRDILLPWHMIPALALGVEQCVTSNWLRLWLFFLFGVELLFFWRRTSEHVGKAELSLLGVAGRTQIKLTGSTMPKLLLEVDFLPIAVITVYLSLFILRNLLQLVPATLDSLLWLLSFPQDRLLLLNYLLLLERLLLLLKFGSLCHIIPITCHYLLNLSLAQHSKFTLGNWRQCLLESSLGKND